MERMRLASAASGTRLRRSRTSVMERCATSIAIRRCSALPIRFAIAVSLA